MPLYQYYRRLNFAETIKSLAMIFFKSTKKNSLRKKLTDLTYTSFEEVLPRTLDYHAPIKKNFTSQ